MPIYRTKGHWRGDSMVNIVHLDSRQFHARLPDRDKLIDEDLVVKQVKSVVQKEAVKKINALKETLPPGEFAKGYDTLRLWDCLALLNDVPVIPKGVLAYIQHYPIKEGCSPVNLEPAGLVTREDVETGKVTVAKLESVDGKAGATPWMYAWHRNKLVYDNPLDRGHWLFRHRVDFTKQAVHVEIVGETHRAYFDGQWVSGDTAFCEKYRLAFGDDFVDIQGDSMYWEDRGLFVVPKGDASGCVVGQASSYFDEYDTTTSRSRIKTNGHLRSSWSPTLRQTRPRPFNACCRRLRDAPRSSASASRWNWTGKAVCCRWSRRSLWKHDRPPDRNSQAD
ncbi:MAG: hypothetical protein DM484_19010 [Candidatus Methylumidiphilus alinenensis]|uniref:Uncharacterized protein n=1 Tax=Candidatus Methylumidiphilus alinenensis TaxID=2202197 RepID=A0A2W4QTJ3_9GAMM|nr:MAG: hypothetical protein DM484_19010 [Candidatus Methylumidiphilus alinenensis]